MHTLLEFIVAPYVESQSSLLRFGQKTPTNRTHFILWPDQCGKLALRAFDRVDFYSFDIISVHGVASFLLGKAQYEIGETYYQDKNDGNTQRL
jgi:hypothetical protein